MFSLSGCDPGDDIDAGDTEQADTEGGDEVAVEARCDEWKTAYCDRMQECNGATASDCKASVSPVNCWSGAPFDRCLTDLAASCSTPPFGCEASNVADTRIAQTNCDAFLKSYCENSAACTGEYESVCIANAPLDCSSAYAVSAQYDDCLKLLDSGACSTNGLPSVCTGVILIQ